MIIVRYFNVLDSAAVYYGNISKPTRFIWSSNVFCVQCIS